MYEWDEYKNLLNQKKHGISFEEAQKAFCDINKTITEDDKHSDNEPRFYCLGKVDNKVVMVVFTVRSRNIRIISAGYWRQGKAKYDKQNS